MLDLEFCSLPPLALLGLLSLTLGCNQPDPPGSSPDDTSDGGDGDGDGDGVDGDGDGDGGDGDGQPGDGDSGDGDGDSGDGDAYRDTLYPLAHGAQWTYLHKTTNGQVLGVEDVQMEEIVHEGQQAWLQVDSPGANGKWDESVLTREDGVVYRVHREQYDDNGTIEIVDYDPGFPRANDAWDTIGFAEEFLYDRTWTDGNGHNPDVEPRGHLFTVLALDDQITVPAGTFDCMKVERVRTVGNATGDRVLFWFAWGVGKVREERPADSVIEELASVSIPGGTVLP